jgi:hypothetical protein
MEVVFVKVDSAAGMLPDGTPYALLKGQHYPADDPVVRMYPGHFTTDPRYGLHGRIARGDMEPPVERRPPPGERRGWSAWLTSATVFLALGQASMAKTPDQVAEIGEQLLDKIDQDRPEPPPEQARTEISCTGASTQVNTSRPRHNRDGRISPPFGFRRG